jgi:hypothetical protein
MNYHSFAVRTYFECKSILQAKEVFGMSLMFQGMAEFLYVIPF